MNKKLIAILTIISLLVTVFSGCLENEKEKNNAPEVTIQYPIDKQMVSSIVMISGASSDLDSDKEIEKVEVKIDDNYWELAEGTTQWSYNWNTYLLGDGIYEIYARSYDGKSYSEIEKITVELDNPDSVESGSHSWAVFIATANFPQDNESKLGNGGLYLAEKMVAYLVEDANYPTSNIFILFDDGWIRSNNGYGEKVETLQEREHQYNINYGGATLSNVKNVFNHVIEESNSYRDSEVFIWIFNHGYGDINNTITGGKLFESSQIFLWDDIFSDKELGKILSPLRSNKVSIIVDACFSGGFADKTIYNFPTSILFKSGIPRSGRVVISSTSKFRPGYASTTQGPIFSLLWFEGITTKDADGYKPGLFKNGVERNRRRFKNGEVSVEEAFYYAKYKLNNDDTYKEFSNMEPQINDKYPNRGIFLSHKELVLGKN